MLPVSDVRSAAPAAPAAPRAAVAPPPAPAAHPPGYTALLGRLQNGRDPTTGKPWTPASLQAELAHQPALAAEYRALVRQARATLGKPVPPLTHFVSEGTLASDPRRQKTGEAVKRFEDVYSWAMVGRMGPADVAPKARQMAISTLMNWAHTYQPSGNPINEATFLPMFQAADLMLPSMSAHQQKVVRGWLHSFVHAAEHYPLQGMCKINNWKTLSLQVRGIAATVLNDQPALARTRHELDGLLKKTIYRDGSSLDFHHRDAFHYHLYNSKALVTLAELAPGVVTAASRQAISRSLSFMKPYYLGHKRHLEFKNTQVAFDKERAAAGEKAYQPHWWDPREADRVLQMGRAIFPEIRSWSGRADANHDRTRLELMASLHWPTRPG